MIRGKLIRSALLRGILELSTCAPAERQALTFRLRSWGIGRILVSLNPQAIPAGGNGSRSAMSILAFEST